MTRYERMFVDLYFGAIANHHSYEPFAHLKAPGSVYSAFLPIPEMQIYVADPLDDNLGWEPNKNFRVDYGFWNGQQLVAVEIDGAEPAGYARDLWRDRMLRRAGVDVIHILNIELEKHGERALTQLLPREFWGEMEVKCHDPFEWGAVLDYPLNGAT
jgi:hypothetical protein